MRRIGDSLFLLTLALLAGFAFLWVWHVGHRGMFLFDQSIVFDGAWRILQGQVPYRDFLMAFGPVTFFLQALAFQLFGVDFSSAVLAGAVVNVVATGAAVRLHLLLFPGSRAASLLSGLLTAVWFQAPFGTLWIEQTAFLFNLLALLAVAEAREERSARATPAWLAVAGAFIALAALSKQNAAVFFLPVILAVLVAPPICNRTGVARRLAALATGVAGVGFLFLVWLGLHSSPTAFVCHVLEIPAQLGQQRVAGSAPFARALLFGRTPLSGVPVGLLSCLVGGTWLALMLMADHALPAAVRRRSLVAALLATSLPVYQNLFQGTTLNDPWNALPYVGPCLGLTLGILSAALGGDSVTVTWTRAGRSVEVALRQSVLRRVAASTALVIFVASAAEGIAVAHGRKVQQFESGTRFAHTLRIPRASRVVWGEPTHLTKATVLKREDLESLYAWLAERDVNFFIFSDSTILYGLLGRLSPQPLLYFQLGHSFDERDAPRLDVTIRESLERNEVRVVILEGDSFLESHLLLRHFPRVGAWIRDEFSRSTEFGLYEVWERSGD